MFLPDAGSHLDLGGSGRKGPTSAGGRATSPLTKPRASGARALSPASASRMQQFSEDALVLGSSASGAQAKRVKLDTICGVKIAGKVNVRCR